MRKVLAIVAAYARDLTDGFQPAGLMGQRLLSSMAHVRPAFTQRSAETAFCTQRERHPVMVSPSQRGDRRYPKRESIKGGWPGER